MQSYREGYISEKVHEYRSKQQRIRTTLAQGIGLGIVGIAIAVATFEHAPVLDMLPELIKPYGLYTIAFLAFAGGVVRIGTGVKRINDRLDSLSPSPHIINTRKPQSRFSRQLKYQRFPNGSDRGWI